METLDTLCISSPRTSFTSKTRRIRKNFLWKGRSIKSTIHEIGKIAWLRRSDEINRVLFLDIIRLDLIDLIDLLWKVARTIQRSSLHDQWRNDWLKPSRDKLIKHESLDRVLQKYEIPLQIAKSCSRNLSGLLIIDPSLHGSDIQMVQGSVTL